jgi:predicted dehydrogenase
MATSIDRRQFLAAAATGMSARVAAARPRPLGALETVRVGVIGTGGRGTALARGFEQQQGSDVIYVCDVDKRRVGQAAEAVAKVKGGTPQGVGDLRRVLDDKTVDAVVVATCNHWHAPAAILACAAGKHVYVEKPCCHNPHEGELMVAAARKHRRMVQMGNQRRSRPAWHEAIRELREGAIGRVYLARSWYYSARPSIGRGKEGPPPEGLDFDLWQGPAPRRPFRDNIMHYNWHWFWHWGNGELGNNGVHMIDLCRWGLGVDYPIRVTSAGGRYHFEDDQETPDTHVVSFDFGGGRSATWTGLSCNPYQTDGPGAEVVFQGDKGSLVVTSSGYSVLDLNGKPLKTGKGSGGEREHLANFLSAIREGTPLNSEIAEGHKSTVLCHLGNIAYRVGRSLTCDPENGHILHDPDAAKLWTREYEKGWEPKV